MHSLRKNVLMTAAIAATVGLGVLVGVVGLAQDASPAAGSAACPPASPSASPMATSMASPTAGAMASPSASPAACATGNAGAAQSEMTVTLVDIAFQPKEITIPANTATTVSLPNKGAAAHNFNIDQLNIHSGDVTSGQTGSVTINAAAGDYQYYCNIPGHKEAGMVGTLHVT